MALIALNSNIFFTSQTAVEAGKSLVQCRRGAHLNSVGLRLPVDVTSKVCSAPRPPEQSPALHPFIRAFSHQIRPARCSTSHLCTFSLHLLGLLSHHTMSFNLPTYSAPCLGRPAPTQPLTTSVCVFRKPADTVCHATTVAHVTRLYSPLADATTPPPRLLFFFPSVFDDREQFLPCLSTCAPYVKVGAEYEVWAVTRDSQQALLKWREVYPARLQGEGVPCPAFPPLISDVNWAACPRRTGWRMCTGVWGVVVGGNLIHSVHSSLTFQPQPQ